MYVLMIHLMLCKSDIVVYGLKEVHIRGSTPAGAIEMKMIIISPLSLLEAVLNV